MRIDYRIEHPVALHASFEVAGFTVLLGASGEGKNYPRARNVSHACKTILR